MNIFTDVELEKARALLAGKTVKILTVDESVITIDIDGDKYDIVPVHDRYDDCELFEIRGN